MVKQIQTLCWSTGLQEECTCESCSQSLHASQECVVSQSVSSIYLAAAYAVESSTDSQALPGVHGLCLIVLLYRKFCLSQYKSGSQFISKAPESYARCQMVRMQTLPIPAEPVPVRVREASALIPLRTEPSVLLTCCLCKILTAPAIS